MEMMSKRFFTKINNKGRLVIIDKECHTELFDMALACEVLNRLDLKLKHYNEVNGEQQATICKLQDLCGESDSENAKLRIENEQLKEENEQLRLELETHKHPLWSTREAERKVNKLADSLAEEVKKNGLLNEEINQLRIENMRLKKKCGDGDMTHNDDFIKGLEQLRKGLDSFKHNLEVAVEQCNETLKRLKEEYDL